MNWLELKNIEQVPEDWDRLAGSNIFLKKQFLRHLEEVNPCGQTYNLLYDRSKPVAIYVDYKLKLNIFTFSKFSLKIPLTILGIPCSVSKQGFAITGGYDFIGHFLQKPGAKLVLNSEQDLGLIRGDTLPTCRLELCWRDFEHYLASMRSHYRYRLKKALRKWSEVKIQFLEPEQFDTELYALYLNVFNNSQEKLEKLEIPFFRDIPLPSKIIKASHQGRTLGFVQLVENNEELIFLFTGFDYKLNFDYDIYLNLLLEIVRYGLDHGFKVIDLGQTTEETKLKLGSTLHPRGMYIGHSNSFVNNLATKYLSLLSYRLPKYSFSVFK